MQLWLWCKPTIKRHISANKVKKKTDFLAIFEKSFKVPQSMFDATKEKVNRERQPRPGFQVLDSNKNTVTQRVFRSGIRWTNKKAANAPLVGAPIVSPDAEKITMKSLLTFVRIVLSLENMQSF